MALSETLEKLHAIDRESRYLDRAVAVLRWDQETYLPEKGVEERSEQLALLEGIAHDRLTSSESGRLLAELGSSCENPRGDESLPPLERDFLGVFHRNYDRAVKLPGDFVSAAARAEGLSQAAWVEARRDNDFSKFLPHLIKMIDFSKRKANYWGFEKNPYDGLLDIYEPGMGAENMGAVFTPLGKRLSALIKKISSCPPPDSSFLTHNFDIETQANFNRQLLERLGFDLSRGRLDVSAHPFTTTLGADDIRITSRYLPAQIQSGIFSLIHESGHAFYEMDFSDEIRKTCLADGASMGIHESQSRLWENVIGRSLAFWKIMFPLLRSYFPGALSFVSVEDFYRAINLVEPSLIRIEADEVSYSLHIILRFDIEKELFSGSLDPAELPNAWRQKMIEYLGVEPDSDSQGVLQDVHWSMGAFGYFPSYALGNLYGLQIWDKLKSELPVDDLIASGNFNSIRSWLRDNIYVWGRRLKPGELLYKITGKELSMEPFFGYIESKYTGIYGL
ncbi:MAG: carboxypeptidase M32 [Treponema sp.]|nr:carboxypeptidase M32 [Treponema sp.]